MAAETILPTQQQPAGHGSTPDLPEPKSPTEWAEARAAGADALSRYAKGE